MTDISFVTDRIRYIEKKNDIKTPIRYDTDNIGIADIYIGIKIVYIKIESKVNGSRS